MTSDKKITERFPSTGALPAEQTAANAKKGKSGSVWQIDKMVYQLVENNVNYAGEQFSNNLKFNSEILANVLYDNIYKLLQEKFEQDDFVNWVADQLVEQGGITHVSEQTKAGSEQEPGEETVYELDDTQYRDLVSQVDAAVELIKSNRLALFKLLSNVNGVVEGSAEDSSGAQREEQQLQEERAQQISRLVQKISGNYQKMEEYVVSRQENVTRLENSILEAQQDTDGKSRGLGTIRGSVKSTLLKIKGRAKEVKKDYGRLQDRDFTRNVGKLNTFSMKKWKPVGLGKKGKTQKGIRIYGKSSASRMKNVFLKKPSVGQRMKTSISNSKVFGYIKKICSVISKTIGVIKKVVTTVFKVGKKLVVGTYKVAKFAAKTFFKASKFVGKGIQRSASVVNRFIAKAVKTRGKSIKDTIINGSGARLVTAIGWRAIKFVGKSIWRGLKKLAIAAIGILKKMFKLAGGFVNKISTYIGKLSAGIMDKAYRFLVRPIANIMVTMVDFAFSVVTSPVQFMRHMIPSLLGRLGTFADNVRRGAREALKSTWSMFKKIMFNPITLGLIIGGLFFFFGPRLLKWITGGLSSLINGVVPAIITFARKTVSFLAPIWECLKTFGGWMFSLIRYLTDPDNWLVRTAWWIVDKFLGFKRLIGNLMKITGSNSVDVLCMFMAGDWIGIAIRSIAGLCIKIWQVISKRGILKTIINLIKAVLGLYAMIYSIPVRLVQSIGGAIWAIVKGDWGDVPQKFQKPWLEWWDGICGLFKWDDEPKTAGEILAHNPIEKNDEVAKDTKNSLRQLKLRGTDGLNAIQKMDEISRLKGFQNGQSMYKRIKEMERLYIINSSQVKAYDKFVAGIWELAGGNNSPETARNTIFTLLESPDFSQKILSVFFYYNPQTQKTMTTRPMSYIHQFVKNLRQMAQDEQGNWKEKIKIFVEALDQLNMERSHIVNNQGTQISKFAKNIANVNLKDQANTVLLEKMVDEFNKGDLFKNMSADGSFKQMKAGNAKTQNIKSRTGRQIGKDNKLVEIKDNGDNVKISDFTVNSSGGSLTFNRVALPTGMNPPPISIPDADSSGRSQSMVDKWLEYNNKMSDLYRAGHTKDEVEQMGYRQMTYEEFRRKHVDPKQLEDERKWKEKKVAGLRTALGTVKFNERGRTLKKGSILSFKLEKNGMPGIYNIDAQMDKDLYLFSDDWATMVNDNGLSDAELMLLVDSSNTQAAKQVARERQLKMEEEQEAERQKRREEAILDYSAKVNGGFIEVKIGEDVVAMEDAYKQYCEALSQFYRDGHTKDEAEARGLKQYTWEEWKRYYRKMHGLPEDGIKRIPFEGKKKKRVINWDTRSPLSQSELGEFGIEMSSEGPVMISIDKAMVAAASLLKGAKKIHSIRDGLEVMKMGLDSETSRLRKRREEGISPTVVSNSPGQDESSIPVPDNPSGYSEPS